ncbi:hypothetical protein [Rhodanobacter hydrolyticus]|uniref:Uncharacterized protein n=1 Tax=Rhodanobacter hydrolyticus TaxID=2250595 RepID=A0ABW8J6P9_9GAMM
MDAAVASCLETNGRPNDFPPIDPHARKFSNGAAWRAKEGVTDRAMLHCGGRISAAP